MEIIIKTLELLFSAFSFLIGYRLTRKGKASPVRTAYVCAAILGTYWMMFLPTLLIKRRLGLSDIGKATILREALCFGVNTISFAGYIGGVVLALLLMLLLTRVPKIHPLFSIWLMIVMPVTAAEVVAFYSPMQPMLVMGLNNLQLAVCCVGAGCVMAQWSKRGQMASKSMVHVLLLLCLTALAGHYLLPQITMGTLQLVGNRVSFTFDMDALYLPMLLCALRGEIPAFAVAANEQEKVPYFSRETTAAVKGVGVVMMFVHHFFTFPHWYVEGICYPDLVGFAELFQQPLAACVPMFAFMTGYFYLFSKRQMLCSSLAKIAEVLSAYWIVQVLLYALAAVGGARPNAGTFLWELIGLENAVVTFNWYIAFYIMAMFILPGLTRLPQKNTCTSSLLLIGLPVAAATAVRALAPYGSHVSSAAQYMLDGVTGLGAGYIAARYNLFGSMDKLTGSRRGVRLLACLLLAIVAFFGRHFAPRIVMPLPGLSENWALRISMDVLYAPILVYALANLLPTLPPIAMLVLGEMGRHSLYMWLLSCVFFNVSKEAYQRLLYRPGHPVLVTLWGLVLCYAAARGVDVIHRALLGWSGRKKFS